MKLRTLAGLAVGFVIGAVVILACTAKQSRRGSEARIRAADEEAEPTGEAPENDSAPLSSPSMH